MSEFTSQEQQWVDAFLAETTLFLGPDPQIMNDHRMAPRTAEEDRLLSGPIDPNDLDRVRKRIVAGLDEAFEMMEQTGAAPGAKWGDLTSAVYSASGDLIHISTGGVLAFASVLHYPVRFINKYWISDPSVGVHDGDAFIHNDARYGNIHNTDQSMILPVFYEGELIAWVATIIHEGENGAKEPGGMPSSSESAYDDGLRMSPFKIVEQGRIRRDLLTFLQNSVREPKLQYQDLKVKLYSAQRIKDRVLALVDEVGRDVFIASLRKSLEDIEAEARRRITELIAQGTRWCPLTTVTGLRARAKRWPWRCGRQRNPTRWPGSAWTATTTGRRSSGHMSSRPCAGPAWPYQRCCSPRGGERETACSCWGLRRRWRPRIRR